MIESSSIDYSPFQPSAGFAEHFTLFPKPSGRNNPWNITCPETSLKTPSTAIQKVSNLVILKIATQFPNGKGEIKRSGFNELKEPIQFIKHVDKKEVTECANYKRK